METIPEEQSSPVFKPRKPFVAFLLSFFFPGLGQVYNGQPKKGILFFGLLLLIPTLFGLTRATTYFYGFVVFITVELILGIYVLVDAVKNAKRQKEYKPKPYNTWYYHLLIGLGVYTIFFFVDFPTFLGIKTFKIPTTSNHPTLQEGDFVVADMNAYKNHEPEYGDIVVFKRGDGKMWTFRVVALPNDTLELSDNIVIINRRPIQASYIGEAISDNYKVSEFEEVLQNGHKHRMFRNNEIFDSTMRNVKDIVIPPGNYCLLGDNRDNAMDSRYEGFVSRNRIKGRIIYSYWGKSRKRINIDFRDK